MKNNRHATTKKTFFKNTTNKVLIVLLLLAVVFVGAAILQRNKNTGSKHSQVTPTPTINLKPATDKEKQQADKAKEEIVNNGSSAPSKNTIPKVASSPSPSAKSVSILLVDAGQYGQEIEVRASIQGVIESGGICLATFTQGSATVVKEVKAEANVNSTLCPIISLTRQSFPTPGSWDLVISYKSASSSAVTKSKVTIE
jgi:hypothetical protein